ncbi:hypothetical protein TRVL_07933 [Trypanosoma vivax]|uniref:Uncharacterized protein n=1 Tax=Trypanosoma vivax (strain Y486) TaxID=1055687 RepID=G0U1Y8_TRYVY|nr:hypothetical protein TRVL_07933 [Trypanosoma vivax]CCC50289.1 conserved hypothetical protein [Trypanosoma vivax Y486]
MSSLPGVVRYERIPTRKKIHLLWCGMLISGFVYQFLRMTVLRVQPKREEQMYTHIQNLYGNSLPQELIEIVVRQREARDTLTLSNMMNTPTPGETAGALQHSLDPRRIAQLRSRNGY